MRQIRLVTVLIAFLGAGCHNESWYPSADARIEQRYEYVSAQTGAKQMTVTFTVHNTSRASILNSAVTFRVKTGKREYIQTVSSAIKIIPGGAIALTAAVAYLDADEKAEPDGVVLYGSFFE
jgi:hypothetical protein